jgi:hypothetical protein
VISKQTVVIFVLALAPGVIAAQTPILLGNYDLYLYTKLAEKPAWISHDTSTVHARTGLCGYNIRGNHRNSANPRVEWDINIDAIHADSGWVSGISAGAFDVVGKERTPKPPIVALTFSVTGDPQPISARIVGLPNADNAIKALVETEPANRLFAGLTGDEHLVTITLKYQDDTIDVLQIRGFSDGTYGGKNSKFSNCLRGYTQAVPGVRPIP